MHKFAKQIMECVKTKVEGMGIDNVEGQNLEELKVWSEIAKNIVCYDKDYKIVEAMEESENEDNMRAIEMYDDYPERRYYDNYRYKTSGRFAPKGKGSYMPRRGYDEPPYYHIAPDMYRDYEPDYLRGIEYGKGKMYYTEKPEHMTDETKYGNMSRYDRAKRGYEEAKEHGKEKSEKMRELEAYARELAEDVTNMLSGMSTEEKALLKQKFSTLMTKIQ